MLSCPPTRAMADLGVRKPYAATAYRTDSGCITRQWMRQHPRLPAKNARIHVPYMYCCRLNTHDTTDRSTY
jgi:hypothetical protein